MVPLLDGWTFVDLGPDGGPYDEVAHPKVVVHTTEGTSLAGAESAFRSYPPHLGYDPMTRTRHQYVRLDRHSYSLKGAESDDEFAVQVEVVGFARETHLWSDQAYRNFATDVVRPLEAALGVPRVAARFYREGEDGLVLASPSSPIRFTDANFRAFVGWCGHQHVPAPDSHWDPGGFSIDRAFAYAAEGDVVSLPITEGDRQLWQAANARITTLVLDLDDSTGQGDTQVTENKLKDRLVALEAKVDALAATLGEVAADVAILVPGGEAGVPASEIATAVRLELARALAE